MTDKCDEWDFSHKPSAATDVEKLIELLIRRERIESADEDDPAMDQWRNIMEKAAAMLRSLAAEKDRQERGWNACMIGYEKAAEEIITLRAEKAKVEEERDEQRARAEENLQAFIGLQAQNQKDYTEIASLRAKLKRAGEALGIIADPMGNVCGACVEEIARATVKEIGE